MYISWVKSLVTRSFELSVYTGSLESEPLAILLLVQKTKDPPPQKMILNDFWGTFLFLFKLQRRFYLLKPLDIRHRLGNKTSHYLLFLRKRLVIGV